MTQAHHQRVSNVLNVTWTLFLCLLAVLVAVGVARAIG